MAQKFLVREGGKTKQKEATTTSAGAADAGKLPALNSAGKLDETLLPNGVGSDSIHPSGLPLPMPLIASHKACR